MTDLISNIKQLIVVDNLAAMSQSDIVEILTESSDLYFNSGCSELTDDEYDAIKRYAQVTYKSNNILDCVGSSVRGHKVTLPYPMGSLDQIYEGDFKKIWADNQIGNDQVIITEKLDGNSVELIYNSTGRFSSAITRGDGVEGSDITRHVNHMIFPHQSAPNTVIRAELIISPDNFKEVQATAKSKSGKPYRNCRNFVAGAMNSKTTPKEVCEKISVVAYDIMSSPLADKSIQLTTLSSIGFITPMTLHFPAYVVTDDLLMQVLTTFKQNSYYEIDGIVIDFDKSSTRKMLNDAQTQTSLNPGCAVKFKIADASNYAQSVVTRVEYNISKDGYMKPTVHFEPVELVGVTISKATGFNAGFIRDNGIGPGAVVSVVRSGDVIPFIRKISSSVQGAQLPDGELCYWSENGTDMILKNKDNDDVRVGQMVDFFSSISVDFLGSGHIQTLHDAGLTTIESIICATPSVLSNALRSSIIADKIYGSLHSVLENIDEHVLMGSYPSFGRGVGIRRMKMLYDAFNGDMTNLTNIAKIMEVDRFETKTATKISSGVEEYNRFYDIVKPHVKFKQQSTNTQMSGVVVVLTGFRSKELEQYVTNLGGKIGSGVSKTTTVVVTPDSSSKSSKIAKAIELNIPIVNVEEFKELYGYY